MKHHYCKVEKEMIGYEGECNWCGEKETTNIQFDAVATKANLELMQKVNDFIENNKGDVVVTKNEQGVIVGVTRQDKEGRILSVISESSGAFRDAERDIEALIAQRDYYHEIIDQLCDAVLGTDRDEWSSGYTFHHAVADVEEKLEELRFPALPTNADEYEQVGLYEGIYNLPNSINDGMFGYGIVKKSKFIPLSQPLYMKTSRNVTKEEDNLLTKSILRSAKVIDPGKMKSE